MTKKSEKEKILVDTDFDEIREKYFIINIVSKRMNQLMNGAKPLIKTDSTDFQDIAYLELLAGKLDVKINPRLAENLQFDPFDSDEDID